MLKVTCIFSRIPDSSKLYVLHCAMFREVPEIQIRGDKNRKQNNSLVILNRNKISKVNYTFFETA